MRTNASHSPYVRPACEALAARLREPRRFMQVLSGARQTGKTTIALQALEAARLPHHYASADEPAGKDRVWLESQWEAGRRKAAAAPGGAQAVLVLDETQKITGWSETVKRLWDEDSRRKTQLQVVLLGSAPLLVQTGLTESLAGRFEVIPIPHWAYPEMRKAFGWSVEQFVYYGGYPGAAPLINDPGRWRRYILDSLAEPAISRDVLLMRRVDKPALLRRLFEVGCVCSGRILSFNKLLGQLQDAGNTVTLSHYLELLKGAGLLEGLQRYAGARVRQRASSPKFQVHNTALLAAHLDMGFDEARGTPDVWGRLVESCVGAFLVNAGRCAGFAVHYWSESNAELDFVVSRGAKTVAIEVKSGRRREALPGMAAFAGRFPSCRKLVVGAGGIPLEEFLSGGVERLF